MSGDELNRVEVMGRVKNGDLKLSDAAVMLDVSYRQAKRLWWRYRKFGSEGSPRPQVTAASFTHPTYTCAPPTTQTNKSRINHTKPKARPRPPQPPAASSKSPYRKCLGGTHLRPTWQHGAGALAVGI